MIRPMLLHAPPIKRRHSTAEASGRTSPTQPACRVMATVNPEINNTWSLTVAPSSDPGTLSCQVNCSTRHRPAGRIV